MSSSTSPAPNVVGLVLRREMVSRGLSKGYMISTVLLLVILVGVIVAPTLLAGPTTHNIGSVGDGNAAIVETATRMANAGVDDDERTTFDVTEYHDEAAARRAVTDGEVAAVLVDGSGVLVERASGWGGNHLLDLLQRAAGGEQVEALVGRADAARIRAALAGETLEVSALSGQEAAQTEGRSIIAYGGLTLTYVLIVQYGVWTLTGVSEEKANRVMEILLSAARPWQLFAGKIIGIGLLGLGQFAVTLFAAMVAIRVIGAFELPSIPTDFIGTLLIWVLLGFALYLVLFGAAGALTSKSEDAQSATAPISVVAMIGFFASFGVLSNPDGLMGQIGTFVPFWAPFVVPIRAALGALPIWQGVLAVAFSIATIIGLTMLSARVYRGGSLQFGGKLSWRQALRNAQA